MQFLHEYVFRVTCDSCGKTTDTIEGSRLDQALECDCCPVKHNHAGLGCRTVTISATAHLRLFDTADLLDMYKTEVYPDEPICCGPWLFDDEEVTADGNV